MKRYFIYSAYYMHRGGGACAYGHVITDGNFPSRQSVLNYHRIPSNELNVCIVTEVKSAQDLSDFLGREIIDEVNYPLKPKPILEGEGNDD